MFKKLFGFILACVLTAVDAHAMSVTYSLCDVPEINTSFKTYEDFRCIDAIWSNEYKFLHQYGWQDDYGFMRCSGESDLGIADDYYLVAMGSYYCKSVGEKFRVTTDRTTFYVCTSDEKADCDTDERHMYSTSDDVIECIVDAHNIPSCVRISGSCNTMMQLNGTIIQIERIEFND